MFKFIIFRKKDAGDMVTGLRYGDVQNHVNLLSDDEICLGGGFYIFIEKSKTIILYDSSVDFGKPNFARLKHLPKEFEGYRIIYKEWLSSPDEGSEIRELGMEVFDYGLI